MDFEVGGKFLSDVRNVATDLKSRSHYATNFSGLLPAQPLNVFPEYHEILKLNFELRTPKLR